MEKYEGIKFTTHKLASSFTADERLAELNHWVCVFADLGLAPRHAEGAYGNHSYRLTADTFIITRTGMVPHQDALTNDYCLVAYDEKQNCFKVKGKYDPSSECYLHALVYMTFPQIMTVMHGHSALLNTHAKALGLRVTTEEFPYGTMELAQAALQLCRPESAFFIMKNHGFVAIGTDIGSTAKTILHHYTRLIEFLADN